MRLFVRSVCVCWPTLLMVDEVKLVISQQEKLGLDVLVHGESERNYMVQYFSEQLAGYAATHNGWVQSYGSPCVQKSPISSPQAPRSSK
ncbi:hypothetical protein ACQXZL_04905 [Corynebacterium diphtheriae]|uniref:hypothetical protein n=1 Tax=Corynebacterium diphtheriae TaxID=1717 RepID=UPI000933E497|nr:hypothetical protein [Corynebacterium diphtheriae]